MSCRRWLLAFGVWVGLSAGGFAQPADAPSTADVRQLMSDHPLSVETWPQWRDVYVKLYFTDHDDLDDFYDRLRAYVSESSAEVKLPEWETDPVAWVIRTGALRRQVADGGNFAPVKEAAQKALSLGDPDGMCSMNLAMTLVQQASVARENGPLPHDASLLLDEAEQHLAHVLQVSPQAKETVWYGLIALVRGDKAKAKELLLQATEERPQSSWIASQYLGLALSELPPESKHGEVTRKFAERLPESSEIQGWHAVALYQDEEYDAAGEALQRARKLGDKADKRFPSKLLEEIAASADLGPAAAEGFQALREKRYDFATIKLREAWNRNHRSVALARGLMFSQINALHGRPDKMRAANLAHEFAHLCRQFPDEGDLQTGYAIVLADSEQYVEAEQAVRRARQLGADVDKVFTNEGLRKLSRFAGEAKQQQAINHGMGFAALGSLGVGVGLLVWIVAMFVLGWILAVCIPRTPDLTQVSEVQMSRREIWLERFYLLFLSVGLLGFYLSVPFVAAGILVVTLGLVFVLLMVRILHYGLLYRGCWAVWHMLRCIFWGSDRDVFGIEIKAEEHPKLFEELRSVAERIDTAPVDRVYLVPGAQVAVSQEGAGPFGLFGRRNRVLMIGISILPWLTTNEFRSVLAHEYGHFSHRDPFFGRFIFQVTASLADSLAVMRAAAGWMNYANPFYGLYWLYLHAYALLSSGYSRSREFLADRRAILAYGKKPFISGLTKIYQEGEMFDIFAYHNIKENLVQGHAFLNIFDSYRDYRQESEAAEVRTNFLEQARKRKQSWFDSHPTYSERIVAAECYPGEGGRSDESSALDLLGDFKAAEETLTRMLTERVHEQVTSSE